MVANELCHIQRRLEACRWHLVTRIRWSKLGDQSHKRVHLVGWAGKCSGQLAFQALGLCEYSVRKTKTGGPISFYLLKRDYERVMDRSRTEAAASRNEKRQRLNRRNDQRLTFSLCGTLSVARRHRPRGLRGDRFLAGRSISIQLIFHG